MVFGLVASGLEAGRLMGLALKRLEAVVFRITGWDLLGGSGLVGPCGSGGGKGVRFSMRYG